MTTQEKLISSRKHAMKWYHANKHTEKYKQRRRRHQKSHMQRHTFKRLLKFLMKCDGCSLTKFDLWKIAKQQKLICPLTGHKLTNENISPDHIIHRVNGGKTDITNIRLVDRSANLARQCLNDAEFIKLCNDVTNYNKKKS